MKNYLDGVCCVSKDTVVFSIKQQGSRVVANGAHQLTDCTGPGWGRGILLSRPFNAVLEGENAASCICDDFSHLSLEQQLDIVNYIDDNMGSDGIFEDMLSELGMS